jgi:hypothetical protein
MQKCYELKSLTITMTALNHLVIIIKESNIHTPNPLLKNQQFGPCLILHNPQEFS